MYLIYARLSYILEGVSKVAKNCFVVRQYYSINSTSLFQPACYRSSVCFAELNSLTVQEFTDSTKLNPNEIPRLMQLVQKPSILGALLLEEAKSMASNQRDDDDVSCKLLSNLISICKEDNLLHIGTVSIRYYFQWILSPNKFFMRKLEISLQLGCDFPGTLEHIFLIPALEVCVEVLIRAHDCFTLSCNMEGISDVLHAARLCNIRLIETKSYSLMVSRS